MASEQQLSPLPAVNLDFQRRFVRLTNERANGFVEFEFAIGEPELFVEMILSREAFKGFCTENQVIHLTETLATEPSGWDWRLKDATQQPLKS